MLFAFPHSQWLYFPSLLTDFTFCTAFYHHLLLLLWRIRLGVFMWPLLCPSFQVAWYESALCDCTRYVETIYSLHSDAFSIIYCILSMFPFCGGILELRKPYVKMFPYVVRLLNANFQERACGTPWRESVWLRSKSYVSSDLYPVRLVVFVCLIVSLFLLSHQPAFFE